MKNRLRLSVLAVIALVLAGCARNAPFRSLQQGDCTGDSRRCLSDASTEKHPGFDLSFVEFSERGSLFDQRVREDVLQRVAVDARDGALVVVFVHGWQHNADPTDDNVRSFRKALAALSESKVGGDRRIHGVYVGWRGLGWIIPYVNLLTYWDRKTIAEEVGGGGLTDFLADLESTTRRYSDTSLVVIGHSFGGAAVLAALNDVLLTRLNTVANLPSNADGRAVFGDGVILLNPAIEANQAFQLKELSLRIGERGGAGARSLHVLSSEKDFATHIAFPAGQHLGTGLTWQHATLERRYYGRPYVIDELELDTATIGNFERFRTHRIESPAFADKHDGGNDEVWTVESLCDEPPKEPHDPKRARVPCKSGEPMSVVYTSPRFIADHSDIFNVRVLSYVAATVSENLFERERVSYPECMDGRTFSFDRCFARHREQFLSDPNFVAQTAEQTGKPVQGVLPASRKR